MMLGFRVSRGYRLRDGKRRGSGGLDGVVVLTLVARRRSCANRPVGRSISACAQNEGVGAKSAMRLSVGLSSPPLTPRRLDRAQFFDPLKNSGGSNVW